MTEREIEAIPAANLRVRCLDFVSVWHTAELLTTEYGRQQLKDWYPAGVAMTCRWLAGVIVTDQLGQRAPAPAPVTRRRARAFAELIDAELLAAELFPLRDPETARLRPGWIAGITATFRWAWRRDGPPPFPLSGDDVAGDASLVHRAT